MSISPGGVIRTPKKSVLLAQMIVDEIVASGKGEGDRLAPEAEMCVNYGVGRATIREALRVLEIQGVIRLKTGPGGGPVVTAFDAGFLAANMALHLQLGCATYGDILNALVVIEPRIAAATATAIAEADDDDASVHELRQKLEQAHKPETGRDELIAESGHFHDIVATGSGNAFFRYMLLALHRIAQPFALRLPFDSERSECLMKHHQDILDAIAAGDPVAAEEAMRVDLQEMIDYVARTDPRLFDEPIQWSAVRP